MIRKLLTRFKILVSPANIALGKNSMISMRAILSGKIMLGDHCHIRPGVVLNARDGFIKIGNNVGVNYHSVLYGHGGLEIGDDSRIAAHVVIVPSEHVFKDRGTLIRRQGATAKGIKIGRDVWIGAGAIILDGAVIPDGCVIGAGCVVKGRGCPR